MLLEISTPSLVCICLASLWLCISILLVQGSANGGQEQDAPQEILKYIVAIDNLRNEIPFSAQVSNEDLPTSDTTRDRLRRFSTVISEDESSDDDSK